MASLCEGSPPDAARERRGERRRGEFGSGGGVECEFWFTPTWGSLKLGVRNWRGELLEGAELNGVLGAVRAKEAVAGRERLGIWGVEVSSTEAELAFDKHLAISSD